AQPGRADRGVGGAASDVLGEGRHVLQAPADLLAVQVDAGSPDGDQIQLPFLRHVGRLFSSAGRPSSFPCVTYIPKLISKQHLFHFLRGRLVLAVAPAGVDENTYEITSACARHIEADSERNLRISASRTCSTCADGLATGLTRLSLIDSTLQPRATAASTRCTLSSAYGW